MRNSFASIEKEPITRRAVERLRDELRRYWEDTWIVTDPNGYKIITVGNLEAILDTVLAGKELKETKAKDAEKDRI